MQVFGLVLLLHSVFLVLWLCPTVMTRGLYVTIEKISSKRGLVLNQAFTFDGNFFPSIHFGFLRNPLVSNLCI